jgi:transposase
MQNADLVYQIELRFRCLAPLMDERVRRQWAAAEALSYGWGGVTAVCRATGIAQDTIRKGVAELRMREAGIAIESRLRRAGGGRKQLVDKDAHLIEALERLVDPTTLGDPQSPLRWTCKSTNHLATELTHQGHPISARTVAQLLKADGYSLQGNRKTKEGASHLDRDAQFDYINATVKRFPQRGQPVISMDTKKKELVGQYKNAGREWQPKGEPEGRGNP